VVALTIPAGKDDKDVLFKDVQARLSKKATRVPVLTDQGAVKYIVHQSLIYRFLAEHGIELVRNGNAADIDKLTLAQLIAYDDIKEYVTAIAAVPLGATVAAAKAEMRRIEKCQDVVITRTGSRGDQMLGWLTNVDIERLSKA
jgi:hypothetical protein